MPNARFAVNQKMGDAAMQKKSFLLLALIWVLPLTQPALAQTRIGPVIGLPVLTDAMYSDSPILGISSITQLRPRLILSLQYQTFGSQFNYEINVPYEPGQYPQLVSWTTDRRTHHLIAGLSYQLNSAKRGTRLLLRAGLGYEHYGSRDDFVEIPDESTGETTKSFLTSMDRLLLVPGLTFDLGPRAKNLFIQLQYGYSVYTLRGEAGNAPQEFAQFALGIRFRVL